MKHIITSLALVMTLIAFRASAGWDEGVAAFTKKDYQAAAQQFAELVKQNPDGWRGHYMLGLSQARVGKKEESLHHLRKAYDLNSK